MEKINDQSKPLYISSKRGISKLIEFFGILAVLFLEKLFLDKLNDKILKGFFFPEKVKKEMRIIDKEYVTRVYEKFVKSEGNCLILSFFSCYIFLMHSPTPSELSYLSGVNKQKVWRISREVSKGLSIFGRIICPRSSLPKGMRIQSIFIDGKKVDILLPRKRGRPSTSPFLRGGKPSIYALSKKEKFWKEKEEKERKWREVLKSDVARVKVAYISFFRFLREVSLWWFDLMVLEYPSIYEQTCEVFSRFLKLSHFYSKELEKTLKKFLPILKRFRKIDPNRVKELKDFWKIDENWAKRERKINKMDEEEFLRKIIMPFYQKSINYSHMLDSFLAKLEEIKKTSKSV
jgi:hypothetical protein